LSLVSLVRLAGVIVNVLAIGAHFDDVEIGCGGSLARHRSRGDRVFVYVATTSGYVHWERGRERTCDEAAREGRAAAEVLGVELLTGGHQTKRVPFGVDLIEEFERLIGMLDIGVVYTHWVHDVHQDHAALGRATLAAARNVSTVLMYRSNWYAAAECWSPNCYVDVTAHVDLKESALRCHASEVAKRGEEWVTHWRRETQRAGLTVGVDDAEAFVAPKVLVASFGIADAVSAGRASVMVEAGMDRPPS
jgi:LmbE family N-acetylglucosaminyl deacetylase